MISPNGIFCVKSGPWTGFYIKTSFSLVSIIPHYSTSKNFHLPSRCSKKIFSATLNKTQNGRIALYCVSVSQFLTVAMLMLSTNSEQRSPASDVDSSSGSQISAFHGTFKVRYHGRKSGDNAGDYFALRAKICRVESRRLKK
jgi:hypothetical protein